MPPATRKLCGFLGHGARRGCSKCKKEFIPGEHFGNKMNFGGFENFLLRTNIEHCCEAQEILVANAVSSELTQLGVCMMEKQFLTFLIMSTGGRVFERGIFLFSNPILNEFLLAPTGDVFL